MATELALRFLVSETDPESGLPRLDPGASARGVVEPVAGEAVRLRARWRAFGPERQDSREIDLTPIWDGSTFEVSLPHEPWSYLGELIRIEWELEASTGNLIDTKKASAPFILAPRGPDDEPYRGAASAKDPTA